MWQFYEIVKPKRPALFPLISYLLSSIAGLYTHYYMFFVVAAQYLFILLFRRDLFKKFLLFSLFFLISYFPWVPFFLSQARSVASGYWIGTISVETIRDTLITLVRGEQVTVFTQILPLLFLAYLLAGLVRGRGKLKDFATWLMILWFLVPLVLPLIISLARPIFFYRYLIFAAVPLMLLPLYFLSSKKGADKLFLLPLAILAIYVFTDLASFVGRTDQHFKPILAKIHQEAKPGDVIYTVLPSFAEVVYYNNYDGQPLTVRVLPNGLLQSSGKALLDTYVAKKYLVIEDFPASGRYWLLEPGPKYALVDRNSY
jgi:hypothetical protein